MNAYCLSAHMPSTPLAKRDADLCAPRLLGLFERHLLSID